MGSGFHTASTNMNKIFPHRNINTACGNRSSMEKVTIEQTLGISELKLRVSLQRCLHLPPNNLSPAFSSQLFFYFA